MNIDIGHINKRVNSTKQTFTKTHTNVDVKLKEPTSVINPTFILRNTFGTNQYRFSSQTNYIYVPDWGYYWIMDIVYETNDIIKFVCARDVAATGKDYIKKVNAYVKYCSDLAVSTSAGLLDDDRFGPELYAGSAEENLYITPVGNTPSLLDTLLVHDFSEGTIILTTIGKDVGVCRWILDFHGFVEVMTGISGAASTVNDWDEFCMKFFGSNWKECITGALYIPVKKSELETMFTSTNKVYAGMAEVTSTAYHYTLIPSAGICKTYRRPLPFIEICKKTRYAFLRSPKYTSVVFQYAGGTIDISNDALTDFSQVYVEEAFDIFTGDFSIKLYATDTNGEKGPCLGAVVDNLGFDFNAALAYVPSSRDQALNMLTSLYKDGLSMSAGAAFKGSELPVATISGSEDKGPEENTPQQPIKKPSASNALKSIGTGILGTFTSMSASPVGRSIGSSSCLATYFASKLGGGNSTDLYRIVSSTLVPSAFIDEPTGSQSPSTAVKYEEFGAMYGFPCNKYVDLSTVRANHYIQCIGANAGNVTAQDVTWTLTTYELTKLNELLNTGIYLE